MGCLVEGTWLCEQCWERIPSAELCCVSCGRRNVRGLTCRGCHKNTILDGVISAGPYSTPLFRRGVEWLKFKGIQRIAPTLARLLISPLTVIAPLRELTHTAVFIPIPLHNRRLRERGFNQSLELAHALSSYTAIPVHEALVRTRATWAQAKLPPELRRENIRGAFAIAQQLPENIKHCLLIDDVTTTGSTLSAAAALLKAVGVPEVWGVTVARG